MTSKLFDIYKLTQFNIYISQCRFICNSLMMMADLLNIFHLTFALDSIIRLPSLND